MQASNKAGATAVFDSESEADVPVQPTRREGRPPAAEDPPTQGDGMQGRPCNCNLLPGEGAEGATSPLDHNFLTYGTAHGIFIHSLLFLGP